MANNFIEGKKQKIPSGTTQYLVHDFKKKIYNVEFKLHFKSKKETKNKNIPSEVFIDLSITQKKI